MVTDAVSWARLASRSRKKIFSCSTRTADQSAASRSSSWLPLIHGQRAVFLRPPGQPTEEEALLLQPPHRRPERRLEILVLAGAQALDSEDVAGVAREADGLAVLHLLESAVTARAGQGD